LLGMPCEDGTRSGEQGGQWRLINPLSIRFSQPRIAPHYRDGHLLTEALPKIYEAPLERRPPQDPPPLDAAQGEPPYDEVLVPPFPAIRVISWRPKIRNKDGEAERDANGEQILGRRAWFALDNRRLHSLQCAAAARYPRRCCVVVRCIEEVPGTTVRELRKFRTTTEGKIIDIGVRQGETSPWRWQDAAPCGATEDSLGDEGLFAEELWDASHWAPQALSVAIEAAPNGSEGEPEARQERRARRDSPEVVPPRAALPEVAAGPQLAPCPPAGWQYVDPSGKVQGPFLLDKMRQWHSLGFFYPDLPMRCDPFDRFAKFAELFPQGMRPFQGAVIRYTA